ncbi:hypothetical protein AX16_007630 [Volvariella volvacea WC 439]|nr:hypothetical protein AX16_007630 [Volvariella volvacea WC 439]
MPITTAAELASKSVDYLIVGGGTAGLTLAARLTENPDVVVGIIEAGTDDLSAPGIFIPAMMGSTIANPTYDWTFFSVPQPRANNRVVLQPRGKGLGGSSLINFLGMARASKEEYDAVEAFGNKGWNWESFLKYMKKSETTILGDLSPEEAKKYAVIPDSSVHGTDGPIIKSLPKVYTEIHAKLFDTAETLGVPRNLESNNGRNVGGVTTYATIDPRSATRSSAASAYYQPNAARPNLLVLINAQVTKVLFEQAGNGEQRAVGVELVQNGEKSSITGVKREVVLAAGSFQTPQVLELSGIGNPDILGKFNIPTLIDLPGVGENLQDHVYVPTVAEIDSKYETVDVLFDPELLKEQQALYGQQKGLLATIPAPAFLFLSSYHLGTEQEVKAWQEAADRNSKANLSNNTLSILRKSLEKQYNFQRQWFFDKNHAQAEIINYLGHQPIPGLQAVPGKRYTTLITSLMHPLSRGTVHIASSDPLAPPAIDPNYFANESDLDLLVKVLQFTLRVYNSGPLGEAVKDNVLPPHDVIQGGSPEEQTERLKEWVKQWCGPVYHPVGTAAMIPREEGGVVDSNLKVYGTTNLRAVDCSVLPMELSCHTQSAAYAIGEKAADIIKGTW